MTSFPASSVVITNLRHVTVGEIRMDCRALILSDNPDLNEGKERRYRLDGFGASCTWHVFDMFLGSSEYEWRPDKERHGFEHPQRGVLRVRSKEEGEIKLTLLVNNINLGISFETIEGTWTPGKVEDWYDYNQRVGVRVFDQACAVTEALSYSLNLLLPIAATPKVARQIFEEDGTSLRGPVR